MAVGVYVHRNWANWKFWHFDVPMTCSFFKAFLKICCPAGKKKRVRYMHF